MKNHDGTWLALATAAGLVSLGAMGTAQGSRSGKLAKGMAPADPPEALIFMVRAEATLDDLPIFTMFWVILPWDGRPETYPTRDEIIADLATRWLGHFAPSPRGYSDLEGVVLGALASDSGNSVADISHAIISSPDSWPIAVTSIEGRTVLGGRFIAYSSDPNREARRLGMLPPGWVPSAPFRHPG